MLISDIALLPLGQLRFLECLGLDMLDGEPRGQKETPKNIAAHWSVAAGPPAYANSGFCAPTCQFRSNT
jgi:hypothetical protein